MESLDTGLVELSSMYDEEGEDEMGYVDRSEVIEAAKSREEMFVALLERVSTVSEKKRFLWLDIYRNAYREHAAALTLFDEGYASMETANEVSHAEVGPVLVKYLERANKANEQLLKLANMIEQEEQNSEEKELESLRNMPAFKQRI